MTSLQNLADNQRHTVLTTGDWECPAGVRFIVETATLEQIDKIAERGGSARHPGGITVFDPDGGLTTIYIQSPNAKDTNTIAKQYELLRHEIRHVVDPKWHSPDRIQEIDQLPPIDLPRGIRNHNPGNLRRSKDIWQGLSATQNDLEFFQFIDATWGIRALARTLITYQDKHDLRTVAKIINRWAPSIENDTLAYTTSVCKATGFGPDEEINCHSYSVLLGLVAAIIKQENGQQPYTGSGLDIGLSLAGVKPGGDLNA